MMNYPKTTLIVSTLLATASLQGLTLEVDNFQNDELQNEDLLPFGYQEVVLTPINEDKVIKVSEPPYVDYLIPNNQGTSGITAQKQGGQYITGSNAADPGGGFLGANNYPDPDRWHVVFEWTDGLPLPFGADYWGVSHSGWSATQVSNLITRIDLPTTEEVTIHHWFNDGWNYANGGHDTLTGHVLTATHYAADGSVIDTREATLPSGGAEQFFGNHRQFYFASITATATGEGEFLIISNQGANIGYKGTAVALLGESGDDTWYGYNVLESGDVDSGTWLGWINVVNDPWIWSYSLEKYLFIGDNSGWVFILDPLSGENGEGIWHGSAILESGDVDTGAWLGWVNVINDPWVWSYSLMKFVYFGDNSGWAYILP